MKKILLYGLLLSISCYSFGSGSDSESGDHDVLSYQTLTTLFNAAVEQKIQQVCSNALEFDSHIDSVEPSLCFVDCLNDQSVVTDSISPDTILRFFAEYGLQSYLYHPEDFRYIGERKVFICADVQRGDSIQKEQLVQLTVGNAMLTLIKEAVARDNGIE